MKKISLLLALLFVSNQATYALRQSIKHEPDAEIAQLVKFLISEKILIPGKYGESEKVPLSYYIGTGDDVALYFGDYICAQNDTCEVTDTVYDKPFAVLGKGLPPFNGTELQIMRAQAQIERTDMKYGADIYDAATWQIALGLAAKYGYMDAEKARGYIRNQLRNISHENNRATNAEFKYGYQNPITDKKVAFTFRMIATNFMNQDPFVDGKYKSKIKWDENKSQDKEKFLYSTSWSDWKPIIGENAWAQLLGPLQAEYLVNNGKISEEALDNAINSLDAFSAMQSGIGAFYYAPKGSEGNQGSIQQGEISLENNFSVLGGLQVFKHILSEMEQTPKVKTALEKINVMLHGGTTVNGYQTIGLLSFIYNGAYNEKKGVFYTHGTAKDPKSQNDWVPDDSNESGATAVDVNTWGMSALGVETVDAWFDKNPGDGTAYKIWEKVSKQGGYYSKDNNELWGVGYTLNNHYENIMSTEWTAGAISVVHSMIEYYEKKRDISSLKNDLATMQKGVEHLRNDQYLKYASGFDRPTPSSYFTQVAPGDGYAYLYASKRFAIPFGWNANTLPSTTSNAWIIMNKLKFNPFQFKGKLAGENYAKPAKLDITGGGNIVPIGDALPQEVKVKYTSGNLKFENGMLKDISINYSLTQPASNWKNGGKVMDKNGFKEKATGIGTLPKGTKVIGINYNGNNGACKIIPATKICKNTECTELRTIHAAWSSNGSGMCDVE